MGLFGRDDKTSKPATVSPAAAPTAQGQDAPVTVVARASRFKGILSGSADVKVAGAIEGEVEASGTLVITESGTAKARLHAHSVVVAGTVEGDITADEKIELKPSARLRGNITAPRILIEEGASFEGQVFMKSPGQRPAQTEKHQAAPESGRPTPPNGEQPSPRHGGRPRDKG